MKIYHNPRCRKSRETLEIIRNKGANPEVIEYLKSPPSEDELKVMLSLLGKRPEQIIRRNEQLFKDNFKGKNHSDDEWITILVENPVLIERPIVIKDDKAILGRPPENVLELL